MDEVRHEADDEPQFAADESDEHPDLMAGEEVEPDHDLDVDGFAEEEGDE